MRTKNLQAAFRLACHAGLLIVPVLLSGCASKGAQQDTASIYREPPHVAAPPHSAQRVSRQGLGRGAPAPVILGNDELRYSSIYDVEPRPDYEASAPVFDISRERDAPAEAHDEQAKRAHTPRLVVVTQGDTLYSLSRRYNVSIAAILAENRMTSTELSVGQELIIPAG